MVLFPPELKISRSLRKTLKKANYTIRIDSAFNQVMEACAAPRKGRPGTWIHDEMIAAYAALHELGLAHSIETWMEDELVGGLYGVAQGKIFLANPCFPVLPMRPKWRLCTW